MPPTFIKRPPDSAARNPGALSCARHRKITAGSYIQGACGFFISSVHRRFLILLFTGASLLHGRSHRREDGPAGGIARSLHCAPGGIVNGLRKRSLRVYQQFLSSVKQFYERRIPSLTAGTLWASISLKSTESRWSKEQFIN